MAVAGELSSKALAVGQRVLYASWTATVRFIGATEFAAGEWVGLELDRPGGKHDGTVLGARYFECPPGRGIFCRAHTLKPLLEPTPEGEAREGREEEKAADGRQRPAGAGGLNHGSHSAADASSIEASALEDRTRPPSSASAGSSSSSSSSASASSRSRPRPRMLSSGRRELSQELEAEDARRDSSKASGGDGAVDLGSREQLVRKLFQVADGDKNGFLDREEFLRLILSLSDALSPEDINDIFDTLMSDNGRDPLRGLDLETLDVLLRREDGFHASDGLLCNALATLREGLAGFSTPTRRLPRLVEAYASPDVSKIGLVFESVPPNRAVVKEVVPDSWADHMGFEPGDELVAVGGRAVGAMTADIFRHALRQRPLGLNMVSQSPNGREVPPSAAALGPAPPMPPAPSFFGPRLAAAEAGGASAAAPEAPEAPEAASAQASRISELEARERALQAQVQELQARLEAERLLHGASSARPRAVDLATDTASASSGPAALPAPLPRALPWSACRGGADGAGAPQLPCRPVAPGRLATVASAAEVERQYQRAYKSREETLGACHPDTLAALASLGAKLQSFRMVQRSEEVRVMLIDRLEKDCDPCWQRLQPACALAWLLRAVNNFAVLLKVGGRPLAAEPLQRWELAAGETLFGPEHPETLTSAANMGLLLDELGKLEEAVALHRRAWQGREAVLGTDHAATQRSRLALAGALDRCGRVRGAEDVRSGPGCAGRVGCDGGGLAAGGAGAGV